MTITTYLDTMRKRWYIPAFLLLAALGGMFIYHSLVDMQTAQATVSVLDPLVAKPGNYEEAQITFDSIVKSNQLAQRVAARLGMRESQVSSRVSVATIATLSTYNASPLYAVRGKGKTKAAAIALTAAATEEARNLFIELNTPDTAQLRQAMQPELDRLQAELQTASAGYDQFVAANKTADLPAQVERQMTIVSNLNEALAQARAAEAAFGIKNGRSSKALEHELATQQAQLDRLTAAESQFRALAFNLQLATDRISQFSQAEQTAIVGEQLPARLQIKLLDAASIQSPFFWLFITYATAILLALLAGFSVLYVIALYRKPPQTADEIARTFGTPVLVRIPRAAS
jgi:hypothetical protein